jgi:hypothetical protein
MADAVDIGQPPCYSFSSRYKQPLYYMTHVDNLDSILSHGILSNHEVQRLRLSHHSIANPGVQDLRERIFVLYRNQRRPLHAYVNLYFGTRTPMLYVNRNQQDSIVYIAVHPSALDLPGVILTDGNAVRQGLRKHYSYSSVRVVVEVVDSPDKRCRRVYDPPSYQPTGKPCTEFYTGLQALNRLRWEIIHSSSWSGSDDWKRQKQAEALIPDQVPPRFFDRLHVRTDAVRQRACASVRTAGLAIEVKISPELYIPDRPTDALDYALFDTDDPLLDDDYFEYDDFED